MRKRVIKKKAKAYMNSFTKNKIPLAFANETERKRFVSAWARRCVGQPSHFPELTKEATANDK